MTKQDRRAGVLSKVRPWSGKELEIAGRLPSGPKFSPLYHLFLGTWYYLQSKLQIPVLNTGPNWEGSRVWCGGRSESTSHRVRKSGFQSWALFRLQFPHLGGRGLNHAPKVSSQVSGVLDFLLLSILKSLVLVVEPVLMLIVTPGMYPLFFFLHIFQGPPWLCLIFSCSENVPCEQARHSHLSS